MIVDMRPVQAVIGLVSTHDLNEQISRSTKQHPYSVGKPPVSQLIHLVGKRSIIFAEVSANPVLPSAFPLRSGHKSTSSVGKGVDDRKLERGMEEPQKAI